MIRNRAQITGLTGLPGLFTAYFVGSTPATTAEATEAAARVRAFWEAIKANIWSPASIVFTGVCDVLDPATGTLTGGLSGTLPVATTGGDTFQSLPLGVAALLRYSTSSIVAGRRVKGHAFIGPMTENVNGADGKPSSTLQASLASAGAALGTTIVTPLAHVVWHRPGGAGAGAAVAVTGYSSSDVWSMLRSRRS